MINCIELSSQDNDSTVSSTAAATTTTATTSTNNNNGMATRFTFNHCMMNVSQCQENSDQKDDLQKLLSTADIVIMIMANLLIHLLTFIRLLI